MTRPAGDPSACLECFQTVQTRLQAHHETSGISELTHEHERLALWYREHGYSASGQGNVQATPYHDLNANEAIGMLFSHIEALLNEFTNVMGADPRREPDARSRAGYPQTSEDASGSLTHRDLRSLVVDVQEAVNMLYDVSSCVEPLKAAVKTSSTGGEHGEREEYVLRIPHAQDEGAEVVAFLDSVTDAEGVRATPEHVLAVRSQLVPRMKRALQQSRAIVRGSAERQELGDTEIPILSDNDTSVDNGRYEGPPGPESMGIDPSRWSEYLLRDTHPRFCTYHDCQEPEILFNTRTDWLRHESHVHRKSWVCPEEIGVCFRSIVDMEKHVRTEHSALFGEEELNGIAKYLEVDGAEDRTHCPLCLLAVGEDIPNEAFLPDHMEDHMKCLCFIALSTAARSGELGAEEQVTAGADAAGVAAGKDVALEAIHKTLAAPKTYYSERDTRFKRQPSSFYKRGVIFTVEDCVEIDDNTSEASTRITTAVQYEHEDGRPELTNKRWFLVLTPGEVDSRCLSLRTYEGHGVGRLPLYLSKSDHSIIHTTEKPPRPQPAEEPDDHEEPMRTNVRVKPDNISEQLTDFHRLLWAHVYVVQHGVKARRFGKVHQDSEYLLRYEFNNVKNAAQPMRVSVTRSSTSTTGSAANSSATFTETARLALPERPREVLEREQAFGRNQPSYSSLLRNLQNESVENPEASSPSFDVGDLVLLEARSGSRSELPTLVVRATRASSEHGAGQEYQLQYRHGGVYAGGGWFKERVLMSQWVTHPLEVLSDSPRAV